MKEHSTTAGMNIAEIIIDEQAEARLRNAKASGYKESPETNKGFWLKKKADKDSGNKSGALMAFDELTFSEQVEYVSGLCNVLTKAELLKLNK